jgi:hypothetical protein
MDNDQVRHQALVARGFTAQTEGRTRDAATAYRAALTLDPAAFDPMHLSGVTSGWEGDPVGGLRNVNRALRLAPGAPGAVHNRRRLSQAVLVVFAKAYDASEHDEALSAAEALEPWVALDEQPSIRLKLTQAVNNIAIVSDHSGQWDRSLRAALLAARLAPSASLLTQYRLTMLGHRRYEDGWSPVFWRSLIADKPVMWSGERHAGRLIILTHFNGLGDFFQFMRFIPAAQARVGSIGVLTKRKIGALLRESPLMRGVDIFFEDPGGPDTVYCDVFSLPAAMGLGRADIVREPFPHIAAPAAAAAWRRALHSDDRPRIGVVWSSWAKNDHRSVGYPFFHDMINENPEAVFIGLHSNFDKNDLRERDFADNFQFLGVCDMPTTAAIIDALDVVIAPDGGIAHLSCAMGKETWVLATRHCDWRWRYETSEPVDWYPSARLFRQKNQGDWTDVQALTAAAVQDFLRRRREMSAQPMTIAPGE